MCAAQALAEDCGAVRWITPNRPDVMNAITGTMPGDTVEAAREPRA